MKLPFVSNDLWHAAVDLNRIRSNIVMAMCAIVAHKVMTGMPVGTLGTAVCGSTGTGGLAQTRSATMISAEMVDATGVLTKGEYKRYAVYPSSALFVKLTSVCLNDGFTFEAMVYCKESGQRHPCNCPQSKRLHCR